jgi:cyanophycinase-like exopeptidase
MARRLVVMGSGETTAGMLPVHRGVLADLPADPDCRLLDSPFAFQENAGELVERIGAYFDESLGQRVRAIHLPADADVLTLERALAEIRGADWLFAGPGSPSYARRCWTGTPVAAAMAGLVAPGRAGALVFASAAAVTLGDWALPVYEVYKVGEDPRWEPGLGLMRAVLGWRCAVVPHWDNREGGTHDTRFCWIGARRLIAIEPELDGGFILGVDEHTAFVVDLDADRVRVAGRGDVVLRVAGAEEVLPAGSELALAEVEALVTGLGAAGALLGRGQAGSAAPGEAPPGEAPQVPGGPRTEAPAAGAGPAPSPEALARAVLGALPADESAARRDLVVLAGLAERSAHEGARALAERLVEALVAVRGERRAARDWAASDRIRDVLDEVGVQLHDTAEGSAWEWR